MPSSIFPKENKPEVRNTPRTFNIRQHASKGVIICQAAVHGELCSLLYTCKFSPTILSSIPGLQPSRLAPQVIGRVH